MTAIVVSNGQVTVGGATYASLKFKASLDGNGLITIHSDPVGSEVLLYGAAAGDVTLNGTTYTSTSQFVADFNTAVQSADLGVNVAGMIALGSVVFAWGVSSANKKSDVLSIGKDQTEMKADIKSIQGAVSLQNQAWTRFMAKDSYEIFKR
jgi:hypothetical protein